MKKVILLLVLCSSTLMAQQFKKELVGQYLEAKVIFGEDKITNVLMRYQPPHFFKNRNNKFKLSPTGSLADTVTHIGGLDAFMIDGNIWALRPNPLADPPNSIEYVVLTKQGAIEEYYFINGTIKAEKDYKDALNLLNGTANRKIGGVPIRGGGRDATMRTWISDSPEIMKELQQADSLTEVAKNKPTETKPADPKAETPKGTEEKPKGGLLAKAIAKGEAAQKKEAAAMAAPVTVTATTTDLTLIVNNYNAWYDERNKGKIKYYFVDPPVRKNTPLEDFREKQAAQEAYLKREKDKADAKSKVDELFATRTTTPSPENASVKDNVPVKKETFAAKLDRIKADGNKVGVILYLKPAQVNAPTDNVSATLIANVQVDGGYLDESLKGAATEFIAELNKAFNRTDIELIDINTVPYRNSKFGRLDDWWASKYKVVFAYTLDPRLRTTHEEIGGKMKFAAELNMVTSLVVTEFVGGPAATKMDYLAQVLNMGSFVTPRYSQDEDMTDVKLIYDKTLEKLGTPILEKMKAERADALTKLVEKKLN